MAELSSLRRRMIEDMTICNLSPATQRSYVDAVAKISRYCGRSPDRLDLEDVRALPGASGLYRNLVAGAEPNGVRTAVLLRRDARPCRDSGTDRYARAPRTLPVVLSADEVDMILFKAAAETLRTIAADPRHLGAGIGHIAVLHS